MGTWTFTELQDYTKLQFGNNTGWETPTDYYAIWVNTAYKRLATQDRFWGLKRNFYFPQLETSTTANTIDGTAYVSVPADCLVVRQLYDTTNDYLLINIPHSQYVSYADRADTTAEGKPKEWVRQGTYLYLWPTPDSVYTIRIYYRKVPASLTLGADVTLLGTEWDEPIVTLAAYTGKMWTMDYEKAKYLRDAFVEQASGIMTIYGDEEKARETYIHPSEVYHERGY